MDRILHLVSKNSSEIIMLKYPRSLLNFCEFDLAYFAENAIAVCDDALRSGELDFDRVGDLRNSLKGAHVYIEQNIRTIYDKIVLDCWIDYVCRRDNIGTGALWNRFMTCKTMFEKTIFTRLCDYRYNRAINEWLNLIRIQDYAKNKINFLFSGELSTVEAAAARRNYFDLMFSVTAGELGCHVEELGVTKVFSVGRTPSAAFMFPNISKDIVKNLLADFDYSEDYSDSDSSGSLSDQIAMDAFSYMKSGLAQEFSSYNISRSEMENSPVKLYMPCGFKAVVDLEIDALIESGGWLSRCKRCGRYFVRDAEHNVEYCSLFNPRGKTCLQIYEIEHPKKLISPELEKSCREITDEMYARVDVSMTLHEYESWKIYLDALHDKVDKGEIPAEELEDFIAYSRGLDISRSNPVRVVEKKPERPTRERVVKPFVPKRIDRSELEAQTKPEPVAEEEEPSMQQRGKSFFTSPSVQQRRSSREAQPVTRIIRAEQSAEVFAPKQNTFTPFGQQPAPYEPTSEPVFERPVTPAFDAMPVERPVAPPAPVREEVQQEPEIDYERVSEVLTRLRQMDQRTEQRAAEIQPRAAEPVETPVFDLFGDVKYESSDNLETYGNVFDLERDGFEPTYAEREVQEEAPVDDVKIYEPNVAEAPPKPKVIRKNAAAISAYGRMSGAPVVTAPEFNAVSRPQTSVDDEPFKDVAAIFDDIQGNVTTKEEAPAYIPEQFAAEPEEQSAPVSQPPVIKAPKKRSTKPQIKPQQETVVPEKVTEDNVPSGIWTEERSLFPEPDAEEMDMLREKKRARSNKTQRLFDAIMREPEDNPNVVRKKKN